MRTFPKSLATFQRIVNERGERLRKLSLEDLQQLTSEPEKLNVEGRPATISVTVQPMPEGSLRVVVQGFMKARILGSNVALDGFYKEPDGAVGPMSDREFYQFD